MGKGKPIFKDENGRPCHFDNEKLSRIYKATEFASKKMAQSRFNELLKDPNKEVSANELSRGQFQQWFSEITGFSERTVKGWMLGECGPSDGLTLEYIRKLESVLLLNPNDSFLIPIEEDTMEGTNEKSKSELKAARRLYKKMNEMICRIRWEINWSNTGPHPDPPRYARPSYEPKKSENVKAAEVMADAVKSIMFRDSDLNYSDECIIAIRNTALDLSENIRSQCLDLVYELLGNVNERIEKEAANGGESLEDPIYESEQFNNYLKNNGLHDDEYTRFLYSALRIENAFIRLDEIFRDYIVK